MSQTLAQRRVLAAHARQRTPSESPPSASQDATPERGNPMTGPAGRAVLTLVRSGARIVEVGPERVRLHREGTECEVDTRGRVDWRPR